MKSTLPSLEQLIRQKIQRRIFAAMAILICGAILITAIESALSYSKLLGALDQRAAQLEDHIISEVLVSNLTATEHILSDANQKYPEQHVAWLSPATDHSIHYNAGLSWKFPGTWTLVRPLKKLGDQDFGVFIFQGNFFTSGNLITSLIQRMVLAVAICLLMGMLLMPIARRTSRDLILEPVKHLLRLLDSDSHAAGDYPKYTEIKSIEDEFNVLMTEKERLEAERIESEQMHTVTRTAQKLAHDIKRPFAELTSILATLPHAQSLEDVRTLLAETTPGVKKSFVYIENILGELLSVDNPNVTFEGQVHVAEFVKRGISHATLQDPRKQDRVICLIPEDLTVEGSAAQLERVITNLVGNAFQAMGPADRIWIDAEITEHSSITLRIKNSGSYIEEADRKRIFQLFYTKGKHGGSGIGLAICKKIVKDHHGHIFVTSDRNGDEVATTFHVILPLAQFLADAEPALLVSNGISAK